MVDTRQISDRKRSSEKIREQEIIIKRSSKVSEYLGNECFRAKGTAIAKTPCLQHTGEHWETGRSAVSAGVD